MAHESEDPDALGSCLAMCEVLKAMGNRPVCYVSAEVDRGLKFIGGDYVVYDGTNAGEHDLCVCLDCGDKSRLGARAAIFDAAPVSINIDHHYKNELFADENLVDGNAPATAELLFKLFRSMNMCITHDTARYLYIALAADTGGFKYSAVTPLTMKIAAELMEFGANHVEISKQLFDTESIGEMRLKGELMTSIHSYCDGRLSIVCVDDAMLEKYGIESSANLVNIPRRVEGTEVAACIKSKKGVIKVSLRSNGRINVADIAAQFGGGGHIMASGATIAADTMEQAEKLLVEACSRAIEEKLGK